MRTERDLQPEQARIVTGVRGVKSKRFSKRFRNAGAMERWMDSCDGEDFQVYCIEAVR